MTIDDLRAALDADWLEQATESPQRAFTRAGRTLGRAEIRPGWTAGQAGRAVLLTRLDPATMYHQGDAEEKLAVLKALPLLDIGDAGVPLLHDALRTNDTRLVAAALGEYADRLDDATWRQGVVKCVFMGVPLATVHRLEERADAELAVILRGLADERAAAGRTIPDDAAALLGRLMQKGN